jgi:hypothetical protein
MPNVKANPATVKAATKANTTKANAAPVTPVTEAPATEAEAPFDHNAARIAAAAVFAQLSQAVSIPVKAATTYRRTYQAARGAGRVSRVTDRQAAALAVAIVASGNKLPASGSTESATFSRRFNIGAVAYVIENGCTSDILGSGLATYSAEREAFTVNAKQAQAMREALGNKLAGFAL